MTQDKINIALYMGFAPILNNIAFRVPLRPKTLVDGSISHAYFNDELPFDTNWDWLMDVVNEIHRNDPYASIIITKDGCSITSPTFNYTIVGDMKASTFRVVTTYINKLINNGTKS
jgi:hypothetical protein